MFTIDQVCEQLGISRSLCYREVRNGHLRIASAAERIALVQKTSPITSPAVSNQRQHPSPYRRHPVAQRVNDRAFATSTSANGSLRKVDEVLLSKMRVTLRSG